MKSRLALLLGGIAVLVAIAVALVLRSGHSREDASGEDGASLAPSQVEADRTTTAAPRRPAVRAPEQSREEPRVAVPRGGEERAPDAQAAQTAAADPDPARARRAEERAYQANVKQLNMYRVALDGLHDRVAKLNQVLQRVNRDPNVSPEARTQIQRQIQELIDSEPRLKARVSEIRTELRRYKIDSERRDREAAGLPPLRGQ